jgi:hypothetical protein
MSRTVSISFEKILPESQLQVARAVSQGGEVITDPFSTAFFYSLPSIGASNPKYAAELKELCRRVEDNHPCTVTRENASFAKLRLNGWQPALPANEQLTRQR